VSPVPSILEDPLYWRARAEEARTEADQLTDVSAKVTMLRIAEDYDRLAEVARQRAASKGSE
jgi:hypothetical protein